MLSSSNSSSSSSKSSRTNEKNEEEVTIKIEQEDKEAPPEEDEEDVKPAKKEKKSKKEKKKKLNVKDALENVANGTNIKESCKKLNVHKFVELKGSHILTKALLNEKKASFQTALCYVLEKIAHDPFHTKVLLEMGVIKYLESALEGKAQLGALALTLRIASTPRGQLAIRESKCHDIIFSQAEKASKENQVRFIEGLGKLARTSEELHKVLVKNGAVDALSRIINDSDTSLDAKGAAAMMLITFVEKKLSSQNTLAENGVVDKLLHMLQSEGDAPRNSAILLLNVMVDNPKVKEIVLKSMNTVLDVLKTNSKVLSVLILAKLTKDIEGKALLIKNGAKIYPALVECLKESENFLGLRGPDVMVKECCTCITNLCSANKAGADGFYKAKITPVLTNYLENTSSSTMRQNIAFTISVLATSSSSIQTALTKAKILEQLIAALPKSSVPVHIEFVARGIGALLANNSAAKKILSSSNFFELAPGLFGKSDKIDRNLAISIGVGVDGNKENQKKATDCIQPLLGLFKKTEFRILKAAAAGIYSICISNQTNQNVLRDYEGIPILSKALKAYVGSDDVRDKEKDIFLTNLIAAMGAISEKNTENGRLFVENGVEEYLLELKKVSGLKKVASDTLDKLKPKSGNIFTNLFGKKKKEDHKEDQKEDHKEGHKEDEVELKDETTNSNNTQENLETHEKIELALSSSASSKSHSKKSKSNSSSSSSNSQKE